jgi:RNA polymerase sigma-70 factor (ECF subfamily)
MIYRRCCKLLGDGAAAQDATQDVFIRFMTEAHRLRPDGGYLPWIYRVATNHCLNLLRDDARLTVMEPAALPEPTTDGAIAGFADRDLSLRLLRRFDEETRDIAVLALVDGLTQDEVADVLGLSRKTVGKKLRRFLERAQRFLREAA